VDDTHALGLYNAPRTIVDAFRLRREVGPELANEALRRWLLLGRGVPGGERVLAWGAEGTVRSR
jgi:hypothetical protein